MDNPAGRLFAALNEARMQDGQTSAHAGWGKIWGLDPGVADDAVEILRRAHLTMALGVETRLAAEAVATGYAATNLTRFDQVQSALSYFTVLPNITMNQMLEPLKADGWLALESIDGLLSEVSPQPVLLDEPRESLLDQTRSLVDEVRADQTLSDEARRQIIDHLREVERALIDFELAGPAPVDRAASGLLGVLMRLSLRGEKIARHPIARGVFHLVLTLGFALDTAASYEALTSHPIVVLFVEHPDQLRPAIESPPPTELPPAKSKD